MTAPVAFAAADHGLDADTVARPNLIDVPADRDDLACQLVALGGTRVGDRVELPAGSVLVKVAAADSGRTHPHERLSRPRLGIRPLFHTDVARAVEDSREHGVSLPGEGGITVCALGIDVGLSGVRAAVVCAEGDLLGAARRPLTVDAPAAGRAEHDPTAWIEGALAAGAEAVSAAGVDVAAVGVGGLGPAPVLVDRSGKPLTPALLFSLDRRAERQRAALAPSPTHDHALPKLLWWAEHDPDVVRRAAFALDATGFLVSRFTGVPTMDAITAADYHLAGRPAPVSLPDPVDPLAIAGGLTRTAADALGVPEGTPVAAGTYDTYVDVAGAGVRKPGDACLLLGSTLVVCRAVAEPADCSGLELSPYPGDGLLLGGWTTTAGTSLDWFRRELGGDDDLAAAAELEPGAGGLVALPYLAGERTPVRDPDARGLLLGLTLRATRTQAYRAFVDAIALSARDHAARLDQAGLAPERWLAAGGGTRNAAWAHATADALGAPLHVVAHAGEAFGPAALALRSIGVEPSRPVERVVEPDRGRAGRFDALYRIYCDLHPLLAPAMRDLGRLDEGLEP